MKTSIAILLLWPLPMAYAQTTYHVFFSDYVEITETYSDYTWYGDGTVKIKVWPDDPARLVVSTDTSRHYLTLYAADEKKVHFVFAFQDMDVRGHTFNGGKLEPRMIPNEGRDNAWFLLLLLGMLVFV